MTLPGKVNLSLVMIVRDEEKNLVRCLESVAELVDEMIVVDTGSKDNTVAIAESYGAKVTPILGRIVFLSIETKV